MKGSSKYTSTPRILAPKVGAFKDFYFPVGGQSPFQMGNQSVIPKMSTNAKNLNEYFAPVQNLRPRVDHGYWKEAVMEAEQPVLPYRVKMQEVFNSTILNGHVSACIQKRKNLTLLKEFHIVDNAGNTNEEATTLINKQWFHNGLNYIIEAPLFGYTLLSFGDCINGNFPNLQVVRRGWISPDRETLSFVPYVPGGIPFMDKGYTDKKGSNFYDFSLYVPTPSDIGISKCGYGLLYKVALYEIVLRNIIGWNSDFLEMFGQPLRHAKSTKTQGSEEYDVLEQAMQQMGSSAYLITDPQDEVTLIEPTSTGTGWKSYDNLESRDIKIISKILLGHADAIDTTPGKLGAGQGGEDSPAQSALDDTGATDSRFVTDVVNDLWIPKLQKFGFDIPAGHKFEFKNDLEKEEIAANEDKKFKAVADWAYTFKQAGYEVPADFIAERLGVEIEKAEPLELPTTPPLKESVKNRLKKIYK